MSDSCDPHGLAHHFSMSMDFPRQEYWRGLAFPSPGDLPNPELEPRSPALQADSLPTEPPGDAAKLEFRLESSSEEPR